jgi:hypothetical protein
VKLERTFVTIAFCPLLTAQCNGVSPPLFRLLILAPLAMRMSNIATHPSLDAQWSGVNP